MENSPSSLLFLIYYRILIVSVSVSCCMTTMMFWVRYNTYSKRRAYVRSRLLAPLQCLVFTSVNTSNTSPLIPTSTGLARQARSNVKRKFCSEERSIVFARQHGTHTSPFEEKRRLAVFCMIRSKKKQAPIVQEKRGSSLEKAVGKPIVQPRLVELLSSFEIGARRHTRAPRITKGGGGPSVRF